MSIDLDDEHHIVALGLSYGATTSAAAALESLAMLK
jgi:hypothetical protein